MTIELRDYQQGYIQKVREAYLQGYKAPCVVAPCGAGKSIIIASIAKQTADKGNHVLFLVHRKELCEQIEETFERIGIPKSQYEVGMVQTIVRRLDRTKKPSLIITDENHHSKAATYRKIYDYFSDVLRLGFTATPIRMNGSGLGDVNDVLVEEVDAKWLISNCFLSPYKYYAPKMIKTENLKLNNLKEFSNSSVEEEMKNVIYGDVIRHYQELASGEQAIAYCHSVEASVRTAEAFNEAGIKAAHIDGKTPKKEREEIIKDFRERRINILCNVDLIGEGFDVPDCSTVIMLRPTQSLSLYIQQSMRGMRYRKGKTSIIIDHVDNISRHGPPDMKRVWSLEGKKTNSGTEIKIKQCDNCYGVYDPKEKKCPLCGYKPEVVPKENEYEVDESAELEEIDTEKFQFRMDFREPKDCKDMKELYELAESRNYKRGWAYHQGKLLGFI